MSAEATGWVWKHSPLKGTKLLVHVAIADTVNDTYDNELWMSSGSVAKKARVSRNTVTTVFSELVGLGYLEVLDAGGSQRKPTRYRFLMPSAPTAHVVWSSQTTGTTANRASASAPGDATSAIHGTSLARPARTNPKEITQVTQEEPKPLFAVFDAWKQATGKNGSTRLTGERKRAIERALKDYPLEDVCDAVRGWRKSSFHAGQNQNSTVYNDLQLCLRDAKHIEGFRDLERGQVPTGVAFDPAVDAIQRLRAMEGR